MPFDAASLEWAANAGPAPVFFAVADFSEAAFLASADRVLLAGAFFAEALFG
ncbi:MAG: hypothetical protein J0I92_22200 [Phyllobacterium sp.]|nr:hypothetical protein [Phyllobacterium sp.]